MEKKTSILVQELATKIEHRSGVELNFRKGSKTPETEWIQEKDMVPTEVIELRTAAQTQNITEETKLKEFNPSFLAEENAIPCRAPGCSVTIPRTKPSEDSEYIKQDLFLCKMHRTKMTHLVSERCKQEKISVSVADYKYGDFYGYTSLIPMLEKAYMHLVKKRATLVIPQNRIYPNTDLVLAEVLLNARNFLTITHALLNPNWDNVRDVLPGYFETLFEILSDLDRLVRLVQLLRDITDIILPFFGVTYSWVQLGNLGGRFGGGVGLLIGAVSATVRQTSSNELLFWSAVGLIAGSLIGSGLCDWHRQQQERRDLQREIVDGMNLTKHCITCKPTIKVTFCYTWYTIARHVHLQYYSG